MAKDKKQAFDKYPGESAKRYSAFCSYRNLSPEDRSLSRIAKETAKTQTPANIRSRLRQLKQWSAEDNWVSRCESWDEEQERKYREGLDLKRKESQKRQSDIALVLMDKGIKRLAMVNPSLNPEDMSVAEAIRVIEIGTRMERHALGVPDQIVKHTEPDNNGQDDEIMDKLMNDPIATELMSRLTARQREILEKG